MEVRIATTDEMNDVYRLTYDVYLNEGYCKENPEQTLQHYPHLDNIPETYVFIAKDNGIIMGTNSLTLDGPNKLHVDEDFPEEVQKIRDECNQLGKILAASWRIVTLPNCRGSRKILMDLINITIVTSLELDIYQMLFSFNPKHERIYKKLLHMETVTSGYCESVNAPGVLMQVYNTDLEKRWKKVYKNWD